MPQVDCRFGLTVELFQQAQMAQRVSGLPWSQWVRGAVRDNVDMVKSDLSGPFHVRKRVVFDWDGEAELDHALVRGSIQLAVDAEVTVAKRVASDIFDNARRISDDPLIIWTIIENSRSGLKP